MPTIRQPASLTTGRTNADDSTLVVRAMGLDIMGPFPIGRRQLKFLVVAIDYFTKWVEVEPLATITEKNIQNFVWKAIICRFGILRMLVSDNGKQFNNPRFRQFSQKLGIHNHYSSSGHP